MSTMTNEDETYQGWANRETWAFNLHWQNDRGLYDETLEVASVYLRRTPEGEQSNYTLGERVVSYWHNFLHDYTDNFGNPLPADLLMFDREVGSWWRIDYAEVGAAVRESLGVES